jgi:hypothetical protein
MDGIGYWIGAVFSTLLGVVGIRTEESPAYQVTRGEGCIEVRDYGPRLVVQTRVEGSMEDASGEAFRRLAGYIFGKNEAGQKVAMTAPVMMEPQPTRIAMTAPVTMESSGEATVMQFVVPSRFDAASVPRPTDERVTIRQLPGERLAVIRYTGRLTGDNARDREKALRDWIAAAGLEATGPARVAGYDSPFSLPFLRRNEVMIAVGSDPDE